MYAVKRERVTVTRRIGSHKTEQHTTPRNIPVHVLVDKAEQYTAMHVPVNVQHLVLDGSDGGFEVTPIILIKSW